MYRGTTPQIKLKLDAEIDFTKIVALWVTFKCLAIEISKPLEDVILLDETNEILVDLTQEDTLKFKKNPNGVPVYVQVRFRMDDDRAYATSIANISLNDILKDGVI